ncbi:IPT/TIG domain-containing protein [Kitasatospora sp. LaBMicrA B282]|uniref:IPT/TIG domain-containing protein n=1 Tax=Kitasatospora sp. LaBMicrA B282 TaxID=3420949 RepID=UPI003D0AD26F
MKIARTLACSLLALAGAFATALPAAADPPTAGQDEAVELAVEGIVPGGNTLVNVQWNPGGTAATTGPTQITLDVPAGFRIQNTQMYAWPGDYTWNSAISPDGRHLTATFVGTREPGFLTYLAVDVSTPTTVPPGVFTATVSHRDDTDPANDVASETTAHAQVTPAIPPAPEVSWVDGFFGPGAGGTPVTITGEHLTDAMVLFGDTPAVGATCTDTECTATTPGGLGVVPVSVVTPGGTADDAGLFGYYGPPPAAPAPVFGGFYIPGSMDPGGPLASGPSAGGSGIWLQGTDLAGGRVYFGDVPGIDSSCGPSFCSVISPPGTGTVDVRVVTFGGITPVVSTDRFTYTG